MARSITPTFMRGMSGDRHRQVEVGEIVGLSGDNLFEAGCDAGKIDGDQAAVASADLHTLRVGLVRILHVGPAGALRTWLVENNCPAGLAINFRIE